MLSKVDWEDEMSKNSVNDVWGIIKQKLIDFKDTGIRQFNRNTDNDVPWLSNKLKLLIKKKQSFQEIQEVWTVIQ